MQQGGADEFPYGRGVLEPFAVGAKAYEPAMNFAFQRGGAGHVSEQFKHQRRSGLKIAQALQQVAGHADFNHLGGGSMKEVNSVHGS